ncbi:MAG: putative bifunctional DNA primase/polymerase [Prokaryotic dsDNA virus sp.]|nr:MAG: putative bifunctional DNA primase/polymerase [Prokaryotic dsDNA virus sp.]
MMKMTFNDYDISIKNNKGQIKTKCPKCSHERKKKNDPCLSVNVDEGIWNCHNCGWNGSLKKQNNYMEKKEYTRPLDHKLNAYSESIISWFKERGISENTMKDNGIHEGKEYMPQVQSEVKTIQFKYFKDSKLINIKYRDAKKNFKLVKDAEKTLYGIDHVLGQKTIIIVEGEMDKLAFYEAGYKNCVSVPTGAGNNKMEYLKDLPEDLEKVYLAVDNDEPGKKLQEELARRLGRDICYRVNYPENCKDINDVLINYNKFEVDNCLKNAIAYPIDGVLGVDDFNLDIDNLYDNGLQRGKILGHENFDKLFSFASSQLTVVTGVPTHGKSNFLEYFCMKLSALHGWKFGVFSPEHYPMQLHFSVLAEKLIGKSFRKITRYNRMTKNDLNIAKKFISNHYHWIRPNKDVYTLDNILHSAKGLIKRYGINGLIIDPYNKVYADIGKQSETNYINQFLTKLTMFKQKYDIHIFLVAHPRKMQKKDNGLYEVPSLYDVAGSANFYNQVDNGITVYRDFKNEVTNVYVQKVKFRHIGELGQAQFRYNIQNGRYSEVGENFDDTSYIMERQESML